LVYKIIQTTAGRVIFNEVVPEVDISMKNLRDNIGWSRIKRLVAETAGLDNMKDMGYKFAFKGGLSFSLGGIKNSRSNHN
jgi:DNA-directed RNA polymerase subunit beta'